MPNLACNFEQRVLHLIQCNSDPQMREVDWCNFYFLIVHKIHFVEASTDSSPTMLKNYRLLRDMLYLLFVNHCFLYLYINSILFKWIVEQILQNYKKACYS